MYDLVTGNQGQHERGAILLAILDNPNPGRYRDAWVERGENNQPVIALYTRNGGGNREHWDEETTEGPGCDCTGCIATYDLPSHPLYLRDRDDEFDSTYATFYFRVPDEHRARLAEVMQEPVNMDERWRTMIDSVGPATPAASDDTHLIYSHQHRAWWRPREHGYTTDLAEAGRYAEIRALEICARANIGEWTGGVPNEVAVDAPEHGITHGAPGEIVEQVMRRRIDEATDASLAQRDNQTAP